MSQSSYRWIILSTTILSLAIFLATRRMGKDFERLPKHTVPERYTLHLEVFLETTSFTGNVAIDVSIKEDTSSIALNAVDLDISSASFVSNGTKVEAKEIVLDAAQERVTIHFDSLLTKGTNGTLDISFKGSMGDNMKGFYRSKYTVENGNDTETRWSGVTQFEATDARRAFPCWDEPVWKAKFTVSLTVPKNRVALSNMPVVSTTDVSDTLHRLTFDESPIMSTYLLAWVVGEYDYVEQDTCDGRIKVRVYTPLGKKDQGRFALDVATKTLPYYEQWFGIEFPLPKMDMIALPDFAAGAMENWGLVTYRETALLVDPASSSATKQWVALVVGHELAHQWFGNLVTMEWWTHLWLNEGFASWIEYLCVDHCFPEWDIWTQFVVQDLGRALELDALLSSHPIEVPVNHPDEVDEVFDIISYSKGCSVIRMLANYVGEEPFKKGLNIYLNRHQYANTFTEDLWRALEEASGKPIESMMTSWVKQMGYPLISVSEGEGADGKRVFHVEQRRFLSQGLPENDPSMWSVPLGVMAKGAEASWTILDSAKGTISVQADADAWIKVNPAQSGVYRVQYTEELRRKLETAIAARDLPATDRLGIQDDVFALAKAGVQSIQDVLSLLLAYREETDYTVWSAVVGTFGALEHVFSFVPDASDALDAYAMHLFGPAARRLGWDGAEDESHGTKMLRPVLLGRLGAAGDPETVATALKRLEDPSSIPGDLRSVVYGIAVAHGGAAAYEKVKQIFRETDLHEERVRCMRALGKTQDASLIKDTLAFSFGEEVRSQDAVFVVGAVAANPLGREAAWTFLQEQWQNAFDKYQGGFLLNRLVSSVVGSFATEARAKEVEAYFEGKDLSAAQRALDQSLEKIRTNAAWVERDARNGLNWLGNQKFDA